MEQRFLLYKKIISNPCTTWEDVQNQDDSEGISLEKEAMVYGMFCTSFENQDFWKCHKEIHFPKSPLSNHCYWFKITSKNWGTGTKLRKKDETDKLVRLYSVPRKREIIQYLAICKSLAFMEVLHNHLSGFARNS